MSHDRVDWFRVLIQLQRAGRSLHDVADQTGVSHSQLRAYIAHGQEPAHWRGEAILGYWVTVTGKGRDSAPRKRGTCAA